MSQSHQETELMRLQKTLYTSKNPTRKWLHTTRCQWICDAVQRYAKTNGSVLEVGPGSGIYLPRLSELFSSVIAADIEQDYLNGIDYIVKCHSNIATKSDDITNSSFPNDCFDMVLCSEVIEHISDSSAALKEIHRILKPGGTLILSTPQPFSPLEQAAKVAFMPGIKQIVALVYQEPLLPLGHINLLSSRTLQKQLAQAGFTIIERHASGVYLPVFSEFFGDLAVAVQAKIETALRGSSLEFLLWTQYYVAKSAK